MHFNFFISDPHFGHSNILKFTNDKGELIRGKDFSTIEEHDNAIIENINKKVRIQDKLFILGDVGMGVRGIEILDRINTKKRILIKGNHDRESLNAYSRYFKDIRAYKFLYGCGVVFSHIPLHPRQFGSKIKYNVHGHLHQHKIDDKRYLNICPECVGYEPLELDEILQLLNKE